jgi:hypothetical protein
VRSFLLALSLAALLAPAEVHSMPQPWGDLFRRDHIIDMGAPGCGKTPHAASLAANANRACYFDPTGEWAELGEVVPGAYVLELVDELGAEAAARELLAGRFRRLVVDPSEDGLHAEFEATVQLCRGAAPFGGLVLLVDEVGDLVPACTETLQGLHRNGHKHGIATILASPCATDFPKRCRDTASRVFSFYQKNARDRAALADEYGEAFATAAATWRFPSPPAAWINPTLHE